MCNPQKRVKIEQCLYSENAPDKCEYVCFILIYVHCKYH